MSKAKEFIKLCEQNEESSDLRSILGEFDYGLSTELDSSAENVSTGTDAVNTFELANDHGDNWIELSLWDKNRFDTPLGSVRFVCSMKANEDSITLSSGNGIEKVKFNNKDEEIEKIPDIQNKEDYKDKVNRIRRVFLGFRMNVNGIPQVSGDPNSFDSIGKKVGQALVAKCKPFLKI